MRNVEDLLNWGEAKRIDCSEGVFDLRKAEPDEFFWDVYGEAKDELKEAGIRLKKNDETGKWTVNWWKRIDDADTAAEEDDAPPDDLPF